MPPAPRPAPPACLAALLAGLSLAASACSTGSPAGRSAAASTASPAPPPVAEPPAAASAAAVAPAPARCASPCASIERCDEATGACAPSCPAGEVYIPATGPAGFTMGKGLMSGAEGRNLGKGHFANTDRPHRVVLTQPFCMDTTEVTVAAYKECVDAGRCDPPKIFEIRANYPKKPDHPVNEVGWDKARKYCEAQGKRLPTEAQWEWAATGADGRTWPWGDEQPTCEHADFTIGLLASPGGNSGCHGGGTSPVKAHPKGNKSWPAGELHDMAGNVWEWCEDSYAPYAEGDATDPVVTDPKSGVHVVRGGGWNRSVRGIRTAFRGAAIHTYEVPALGFRCVRAPSDPPAGR